MYIKICYNKQIGFCWKQSKRTRGNSMFEETATVKNKTGLHARPASEFVKLASAYNCEIMLKTDNKKVNAKSIIGVLSTGISQGKQVTIIADGEDEQVAVGALKHLLETYQGEN